MPPTSFSQLSYRFTHVGMGVHRDSISVGILSPDFDTPEVERISVDDAAVRALFARLGDPARLRACYEAGPTGYGLARLHRMGELSGVRVPTVSEEGVRDLCRARRALVADRRRARQRLTSMLLRHGQVYRAGSLWSHAHRDWLGTRRHRSRLGAVG